MSQVSLDRTPSRALADRSGRRDVRVHWDALLGAVRIKSVGGSGRYHRGVSQVERETVSVVIPCYNYGRYLPDAVASVLRQDLVDVEVIIVDDASTDDSVAVARELREADPRVRLIEHPENRGHIATYNDGLAEVSGDYVVLLSADDQLTPGCLAHAVAVFQALPEVGLVYGEVELVSEIHSQDSADGESTSRSAEVAWISWDGTDWLRDVCRFGGNVTRSPEVVVRARVQRELGGYDPEQPHAADFAMWLGAARISDVARLDAVQAQYRLHDENMHSAYAGFANLTETRTAFVSTLCTDAEAGLRRTALLSLASQALHAAAWIIEAHGRRTEAASDLIAFSVDAFPDSRNLRRWSAVKRRERILRVPRPVTALVLRGLLAKRGVTDAMIRRWWRWRGILPYSSGT